jgi:hypothetical protein
VFAGVGVGIDVAVSKCSVCFNRALLALGTATAFTAWTTLHAGASIAFAVSKARTTVFLVVDLGWACIVRIHLVPVVIVAR